LISPAAKTPETQGEKKPAVGWFFYGAENRNRTCDPLITNEMLYQLSYFGMGQFYDF
jgi:hypothetical protein